MSIIKYLEPFFIEYSVALKATEAGSEPWSDFINFAFTFSDHFSSWDIAAALKVSAAAKTILVLFSDKIFPSFPIVVVFPTPFTPATTITFYSFSSPSLIFFSSGLSKS